MNQDTPIQPIHEPPGILAYDLAIPVQPLLPAWTPFRYDPAEMAANARRDEAERRRAEVRVAQEAATALKQWRAFRERYADNPIVAAVLDIHQPGTGYDTVVCSECEEHNGYEDTQQVTWPCRTYGAIRAAAETPKEERVRVSSVTDIVLVIPASAWRGHGNQIDLCVPERAVAVRFADLFESFPQSPDFSPVPVQDNGTKNSGATVFHLGVNHIAVGFVEALRAEPWPPGTVLYLQHEDDDEPAVTVWTRHGIENHGACR